MSIKKRKMRLRVLLIVFGLLSILLISGQVLAQSHRGKKVRTSQAKDAVKRTLPSDSKIENSSLNNDGQMEADQLEKEFRFRSSIRYVVVYNDIIEATENRIIDVLISEKQYNKRNLIKVFDLIKERFPLPVYLSINVHTSLATIETPEERDKETDGNRLFSEMFKYKTADYDRLVNGTEGFHYVISLVPYREKIVILSNVVK